MTRLIIALALASSSCVAIAAPPITEPVDVHVTNPVVPVEVSNADPVLVRDADRSAVEPFQVGTISTAFNTSSSSADVVTVPAGKLLVVEHVSAWINASGADGLASVSIGRQNSGQFDQIECHQTGQTSNGLNHFFACSGQTKFYVAAGETLQFFVSVSNSDGGFHRAFVSGHYVPAP